MTAQDILAQVYADKQLAAIRKKIESGTAAFSDTALYSERVSELIGGTLSALIPELPAGERERLCTALLRGQYEDTNRLLASVQRAQDEALGLHLAPQKTAFPAERVQQLAQSLEDMTVPLETLQRRAKAPVANVSKSFHDGFMQENAKFRHKAGLKCFITRTSSSGCCPWCAEVSGKFEFGDAPDDIFRRHDNCDCTVIYDNQVLRGKYTDDGEHRSKTWEQVGEIPNGFEPTVFTDENRPEGFVPKILTPGRNGGIMNVGSDAMSQILHIGQLNTQPLEATFGKLQTSEVIVTDERIEHIQQRHPEDFQLFQQYGKTTVESPDVILKDSKNDGTVFMIKKLPETNLNVVVRLVLMGDNPDYKNSVMTFYRIREKNLKKLEKKNEVLYKKE